MQFTLICSALLACAGLSSAAAPFKRWQNGYTDEQVKQMWKDPNMVYDNSGICTWDGKCEFPTENVFGTPGYDACSTGACGGAAKGQKCIKGWDNNTRCPGGPHY